MRQRVGGGLGRPKLCPRSEALQGGAPPPEPPLRLVLLVAALATTLAAPALADPASPADREALLALERAWNEAIVDRDTAALERILAPDFRLVTSQGVTSREALIAAVRSRRAEVLPFVTEDVEVRTYGDTAIMTGRFNQTMTLGADRATATYRYTDVYRRQAAGWVALSAQATVAPSPEG